MALQPGPPAAELVRERLGNAVAARRKSLGLTQPEVRDRGGPSVETLRMLENGRYLRIPSQRLRDRIERGLQWPAGTVAAILENRELPAEQAPAGGEDRAPAGDPGVGNPDPAAGLESPADAPVTGSAGSSGVADFTLVNAVLDMRSTFVAHSATMPADARDALREQIEKASRDAEDSVVAMLGWLDPEARGTAFRLLTELHEPL